MAVYMKKLRVDDQEFEVIDDTARDDALLAQQMVRNEESARTAADIAIQQSVSDEASTRTAAISAETTERQNADTELSTSISEKYTEFQGVKKDVESINYKLAVGYQDITLNTSAITNLDTEHSSCRAYGTAGISVLTFNISGAIVSTNEVTIGTLESALTPTQNFYKICQTQSGNKYILAIRTNGNIGIQMIDAGDSFTRQWFRETISYIL